MKESIWIIVWAVVILGLFAWLWRAGHLARLAQYVRETREELDKCSWPTWQELKESTVVVTITIILLGTFTVAVEQVFIRVLMLLKL